MDEWIEQVVKVLQDIAFTLSAVDRALNDLDIRVGALEYAAGICPKPWDLMNSPDFQPDPNSQTVKRY